MFMFNFISVSLLGVHVISGMYGAKNFRTSAIIRPNRDNYQQIFSYQNSAMT